MGLVLTKRFFDEITLTSRLVKEISQKSLECEGIIASKGEEYYSIVPTQEVKRGNAILEDIVEPFVMATGCKSRVIGIWHSHASFPVFHSCYDNFHFKSTIIPLVRKQNNTLNLKPESISSIVINNRSTRYSSKAVNYYALSIKEEKSYSSSLELTGEEEYIDAAELLETISTKISYQGVLLKDMGNYLPTLSYYKKVKSAIWKEVFRRIIKRLERRKKNETGKGKKDSKTAKGRLKKKDSKNSKGDKNTKNNNKQVDQRAGCNS
ncbi:MAG: hypothetical protein ABIB71_07070 [Candidatus Woesearchaeota archaeon]